MNRTCTFFGHRDAPPEIQPAINAAINEMIHNHSVRRFYVGNEGYFDAMVQRALLRAQSEFPQLQCLIVLARIPDRAHPSLPLDTVFPEGFESFPPRFAISRRNRWILDHSDCAITYIRHSWGGAAGFAELARRQQKLLLPL